ncbi:murein DD-endopeptidase MepM/ murein hydrolase activator NlpD [Erythromicrobium ramosum]|uniref:Murein DD-endopeptidase MepM/ murein hydrolase activator NlpD n=1 Tax=Erythrobacter ramosus TaxID=35811 RepID=A0A6I4UJF7_9SPHN|nr:M23 family metallopeptidase [Erythrobacter ramosus]MBB3774627.1 murein DD-endopeptidase MepM/ murein hydrolase activator NlpD [Erythrobacter ramosus]MXP37727.1 peptidoglycan DD-metalloendopeptidase family protein [Erythrobacter ramosus]
MKFAVRHMLKLAVSAASAILVSAAAPALANTANSATTTASADVTQPLREGQPEVVDTGDARFKSIFSSWTAMERTSPTFGSGEEVTAYSSPIPQRAVSVPSRMPLEGASLTSGFGMRTHPVLGGRRAHAGIDLAAPTGTPVYATADGVIGRADWYSSYGLYISINHGAAMETRYAHLSRLAVAAGDNVKKGDLIGYVGSTGRSTGPHLHYEVRVEGLAVNPIPYMVESEAQLAYARDARLTGQGGE